MLIPGVGMTFKQVIKNIEKLEEISIDAFAEEVLDAFNGYCFRGDVEEVVGFDTWPDLKKDGDYELNVRHDHEDAYVLTITCHVKNEKISVSNVL